jgi:uncharacterized RDD family membrane protein YckC
VVGRRVGAGFIDLVPLLLISAALSRRTEGVGLQFRLDGLRLLLFAIIALAYYFVCELVTGTTPGKRLVGLTVIDEHGGRPGAGAVAKRTLLRIVDAIPALYLVGFVAVVSSPDRQRLGDMVARTRVVSTATAEAEAAERGAPAPVKRSAFLVVVAAVALVGGVVGIVALAGTSSPSDRLGRFEVARDMEPRIAEVMAAFEDPDVDAVTALFADGVTTPDAIQSMLTSIDDAIGPYTGEYRIVDHQKVFDVTVNELKGRTFDVMQFKLDAEFERGTKTVIISFADIGDELQLLGWNVG